MLIVDTHMCERRNTCTSRSSRSIYRSLPEKNDYRDLDLAPPFPENAHTVHVEKIQVIRAVQLYLP